VAGLGQLNIVSPDVSGPLHVMVALRLMFPSLQVGFTLANAAIVNAVLVDISGVEPPDEITAPGV